MVQRAVAYLRSAQNPDGGFGQSEGSRSNAQSTAWAVQGLVAAGRAPTSFRREGHSPLTYLTTLQQPDGSFRYSRSSTQTPVWVTAQVIAALQRKAFPVEEPQRHRVKKTTEPAPQAKHKARLYGMKRRGHASGDRTQTPRRTQPGEWHARGGNAQHPAPKQDSFPYLPLGAAAALVATTTAYFSRRRGG